MAQSTRELLDRLLADFAGADPAPSKDTMYGYRSLAKRLSTFCPKAPVAMPAFKRYLDDTGKGTLSTVRRRYDFANRLFNSAPVQDLGLPNPCDLIARPGKIVTSSVRQRREHARAAATPEPVEPEPEPSAAATVDVVAPERVIDTREVVDGYLERCRLRALAKATIDNYRYVLDLLAEASPTLPATEDDIYEVMGDPDYVKNGTRRQRYGALSAFANSDIYKALKLSNPLDGVPRPPKKATPKRTFDDKEVGALLAEATPQEAAFVRLGMNCGPRVGEVASITVAAIQDAAVLVEGKSGLRSIPVDPDIAQELRGLANDRNEIWYDDKGRLTDKQLARRFRAHAKRAGITGEQIGPHTLRRSFATRWALAGWSMPLLQEILGHAELSTTMDYVGVIPEHVRRAHAEFSAAAQVGSGGRHNPSFRCSNGLGDGVSGLSPVQAEMARLQGVEDARLEVALGYLAQTPCVERPNGRRRKTLPQEIARMVILDLEAEHSHSAIVRRYAPVARFSRTWLAERIADGTLWEMAGWSDRLSDSDGAAA